MIINKTIAAILKINPDADVTVKNEDIDSIQWNNGTTPIPKAQIEEKLAEVEEEFNNQHQKIIDDQTSAKTKLIYIEMNAVTKAIFNLFFIIIYC